MLEFPLHDGFFPQIALSREELEYYKRLGKERVTQLVRIIEDADCAYKWNNLDRPTSRGGQRSRRSRLSLEAKDEPFAFCQQANFLDIQPTRKATHASTLLKASVQLVNTKVDEILRAVAKVKTKDFRNVMRYMYGDAFVDGRTLFTFPKHSGHTDNTTTFPRPSRPSSSYRAIKWHALKTQRTRHHQAEKIVDFCYLEYAGKRKLHPGSSVVGFCIQESISRDREVPTLENFGIARGYLSRMGYIISQTHHANTFQVTLICQIDGDLDPRVRHVLENLMKNTVGAVARIPGLVARQRVSSLRFVEQWQWVPNADRKACAVCLRGFYFRRKHHCRTCGEVVCSSCAMLQELEEPIFDITHLRVCSACMTSAGNRPHSKVSVIGSATGTGENPVSSTSNDDTESYLQGLRSPQQNFYDNTLFHVRESRDRDRRQSALSREILEATNVEQNVVASPRGRKKSVSSRTQDKLLALTHVVNHIRQVRDTINLTMSEAAEKEHVAEVEEKEFNDMYSEITSIRDALESSVSNFDTAMAHATTMVPAMYYSSPRARSPDSGDTTGPTQDEEMTSDQLNSVARITFAAARATRQAGQAFLAVGERPYDMDTQEIDKDESDRGVSERSSSVASDPTAYDSDESSSYNQDPYSASNYEKLMAIYQPEYVNSEYEDEENRPLGHKFTDSVRRVAEIHELEKKIYDLQQSLQAAQQKLSMIDSNEPNAKAPQRLHTVRERSEIESVYEIFGERDEDERPILNGAALSVSSGSKAMSLASDRTFSSELTTQDLVSELRDVMASSEMPVGAFRTSFTRSLSPPSPRMKTKSWTNSSSSPVSPSLRQYKIVDCLVMPGQLASNLHESLQDTKKSVGSGHYRPSDLQPLGTTGSTYGDDEDYASVSSKGDSDEDLSNDTCLFQTHFESFSMEKDQGALLQKRKTFEANPSRLDSPLLRFSPSTDKEERDEVRERLAGLVRPRSASAPFQSSQRSTTSSDDILPKASRSDDAARRVPTAYHVEEIVREIRASLLRCRWECPSETERVRKLMSISKVLRSLHREGVRSKFRSLQYDDIGYSKLLQTSPSIIKLLKLAGYVSFKEKLTIRQVKPDYLAMFLRELEQEMNTFGTDEEQVA
ncbi:hypothetical protein CCR75_001277 [Bremia lactucae]|uniref:FYVE-type domain-containing protein n=1 Tax=Bremia lactucae TaxID=4779 RepID=A0A976FNK6_BRELC|nr:hypothetical protein CCR75_001277 [Bremia lactucae]